MELNITEDQIQATLKARRSQRMGAKLSIPPAPTEEKETGEIRHILHQTIHDLIEMRENIWMVGPAGSGKSKVAEIVAEELEMPYYAPPIGRETTNAQLFGYFNAAGNYVRTPIRECVENGGVLHLEEIDFASPAVGTALNALLANEKIGFPDLTIQRHKDCIILASANTFGTGANATYIGSMGLNAATLDRFIFVDFPYDERMEKRIAPNKDFCLHVQSIRRKVNKLGLKHVVSPRATIKGGKMINSGKFTLEQVEKMVIFKGLDKLTVDKINATSDV
jgi:MoxR-like ATPase